MAKGDVTLPQATGFLGLQLAAGLGILTQLNWYRYVNSILAIPAIDREMLVFSWVLHRYPLCSYIHS